MPNVHKDFHGALSYGLQFLEERHGTSAVEDFLSGLAQSVYKPLVDAIQEKGIGALRDHWQNIFDLEDGDIDMREEDGVLILDVHRCPAVTHMREQHYSVAEHFCEHTRIVNEAICHAAGYKSAVEYDQEAGSCTQRFWRANP